MDSLWYPLIAMEIHGLNKIHGLIIFMHIHKCLWISMNIQRHPWIPMDINGWPWASFDNHRHPLNYIGVSTRIHRCPWRQRKCIDNHWSQQIIVDIHWYKRKSIDIYTHLSTSKSMGIHSWTSKDIYWWPCISLDDNGISIEIHAPSYM